jgi:hypothetical protein
MKKIKRQLIKIQNNLAKGGGKIPSISEALIMLRKAQGNDKR